MITFPRILYITNTPRGGLVVSLNCSTNNNNIDNSIQTQCNPIARAQKRFNCQLYWAVRQKIAHARFYTNHHKKPRYKQKQIHRRRDDDAAIWFV